MSKNKYYGVRYADGKTKIFEDWPTCKNNILGKKGVAYKGFTNKEEAQAYVLGQSTIREEELGSGIAVYVDGSYRDSIYSYGFVVVDLKKDKELYRQNGKGVDEEAARLRNVSGEMKGAMEAVNYCLRKKHKEITICYDYSGIENWALGTWKRNNAYTQKYHEFMMAKKYKIKMNFCKIKGHSGDKWNDLADLLAKEALE